MFSRTLRFLGRVGLPILRRRQLGSTAIPNATHALVAVRYGSLDDVIVQTLAIPELKSNCLLVKVAAASINPIDLLLLRGYGRAFSKTLLPLPLVLGRDFSGTVVATGDEVWNYKQGDHVFGVVPIGFGGSLAEYVVVRSDHVARKPQNLSHVEAASLPFAGTTAWQAVHDVGKAKTSEWVLVHGASGGVGSIVIQLLRHAGCRTVATCGARNRERVAALGADIVTDLYTEVFEDTIKQKVPTGAVDVVIDTIGGDDIEERSVRVLKRPGGRYVSLHSRVMTMADERGLCGAVEGVGELALKMARYMQRGQRYCWLANVSLTRSYGEPLEQLREYVERGVVRPVVDQRVKFGSLHDGRRALQYYESRQAEGKVVVCV